MQDVKMYAKLLSTLLLLVSSCEIYSQEKMEIEGAIIIADSEDATPTPGTIRWTGADFEGWNGIIWVSLTGNMKVGTVSDVDGNVYKTITIGTQEWMTENLRTSKYNDETTIDAVTSDAIWAVLNSGAWCWYDNDNSNESPYGKLYNWHAVNTAKLCPTDWHVPSDGEWTTLTAYLGGEIIAGGKIKEEGFTHWSAPNLGATNVSGFTGLPGGARSIFGFSSIGDEGYWWSSTESSSDDAWNRDVNSLQTDILRRREDKKLGMSVRCVRD